MKIFTEEVLKDLGFERTFVTAEESGYEKDFTYYTYDLDDENRNICLISSPYEEGIIEGEVMFFEGNNPLSKKLIESLTEELPYA